MSIESNRKILIGSLSSLLDKKVILGDNFSKEYLRLTLLIVKSIEYCTKQYQANVSGYSDYINLLTKTLNTLKYKCPDVCIYKDKLIIRRKNTAPTIEDNVINIPLTFEDVDLKFTDVVHNYQDAENDYISQVIILSDDEEANLKINTYDIILNNAYELLANFSISYNKNEDLEYFIKNLDTDPCTANIYSVNKVEYENALLEGELVDVDPINGLVFQKIVESTSEITDDTIIYAHIDKTSLSDTDADTIGDALITWYTNFKISNPTFAGSLLINTKNNSDIDNDYAIGRDGGGLDPISDLAVTGVAKVLNSTLKDYEDELNSKAPQENWLQNPTEGLLRQAWKEGIDSFEDEASFFSYIQDKSLIVLSFVDESNTVYHLNTPQTTLTEEPTYKYTIDYSNFISKVRSKLSSFKGTLYPVTRIGTDYTLYERNVNSAFLLHALAAIEGKDLTGNTIDILIGQEKYLAYNSEEDGYVENTFYPPLANNPYKTLNGLKSSGWGGVYTKVSSNVGDNFDPIEFANEIDDLISTQNIIIKSINNYYVTTTDLGENISTEFALKVRDNNVVTPLFSNSATITINHIAQCTELSENISSTIELPEGTYMYTFTESDIFHQDLSEKIVIQNISGINGTIYYKDIPISNSILPIVILRDDVSNGEVTYSIDTTSQVDYAISITYGENYIEDINYNTGSTITLRKEGSTIVLPLISIPTPIFEIPIGENSISGIINATVAYSGSGSVDYSWEVISGDSNIILINPTEEDLQVGGLIEGVYTLELTVTESIGGLSSTGAVTFNVTNVNIENIMLFGGNQVLLEESSTETEVGDVLEVLQQQIIVNLGVNQVDCDEYNDFDPNLLEDEQYYTYIALKVSTGTINSIIPSNFPFESYSAFTELGVFTYLGEEYFILRSSDAGVFNKNVQLTINII